jgi:hypothetical protein
MSDGPNCISEWYPKLIELSILTPRTVIVDLHEDITPIAGGTKLKHFGDYVNQVRAATDEIGYPCFLRSGLMSGKHSWKDTCYVTSRDQIAQRMYNLAEECACCDFMGRPCSVFAARELIPTTPICIAFHGDMPITREFRFFVADGSVCHVQPYWPEDALEGNTDTPGWKTRLEQISKLSEREREMLGGMSVRVGKHFGGYWSIDWLQSTSGEWYLTDMALGAESYRYDP